MSDSIRHAPPVEQQQQQRHIAMRARQCHSQSTRGAYPPDLQVVCKRGQRYERLERRVEIARVSKVDKAYGGSAPEVPPLHDRPESGDALVVFRQQSPLASLCLGQFPPVSGRCQCGGLQLTLQRGSRCVLELS